MISTLFGLGMACCVAAPGPKDAPAPAIIGEWVGVTVICGGKHLPGKDYHYVFAADGKLTSTIRGKVPEDRKYKLGDKADPKEIDLILVHGGAWEHFYGIYKIEGDRLTICVHDQDQGPASKRPKEFESAPGSDETLMIFNRVKKKD